MKKVLKRVLMIIGVLVVLLAGLFGYYKLCMDPYRGTVDAFANSVSMDEMLSGEEAKEDLKFLIEHLQERHPAWLEESEELVAAVEAQYEQEVNEIGEEISVMELDKAAARITARLHDGHTYVAWKNDEEARYIDDFTQLWTYGKPIAIDGIPTEEVVGIYMETASYEREEYANRQFFGRIIVSEHGLCLSGIDTSDEVTMTFENNGEIVEYSYKFVPIEEVNGYTQSTEESKWVSYEIDEENSVGIFTLTACICDKEYEQTLDEFFQNVFDAGIQNVVVDLRGNGGGNSWVANEFITYLDVEKYRSWDCAIRYGWYLDKNEDIEYTNQKKKQVFDGNVYVLTDIWTYSAAMDFAMLIADNDMGVIIGEASGNLPDSYGDCLYFQMPNSKLAVSISYKRWYRIDQTKSGEPIMPDYETSSDEALQKVYELIP